MNYFKIIADGRVVDVGEIFLRWQEKNRILISCPLEEAQLVQGHDGETIYRVPWLNPLPEEAGSYESVEAAIIDRQEYLDLLAVLEDGEQPIEPEPPKQEPEPEPEPDPEQPEEEKPMTVAEMRQRIKELEARNDMLLECLLEMSEIVYAE